MKFIFYAPMVANEFVEFIRPEGQITKVVAGFIAHFTTDFPFRFYYNDAFEMFPRA